MAENRNGDILGKQGADASTGNTTYSNGGPDIDLLKSIDKTLKDILASGGMSQSAARSSMPGSRDAANKWEPNRNRNKKSGKSSSLNFSSVVDDFTDGLESALLESVLGSDFKKNIGTAMSNFANAVGIEFDELPKALGKQLGQSLLKTKYGDKLSKAAQSQVNNAGSRMKSAFMSGVDKYQTKYNKEHPDNQKDFKGTFNNIFNTSQSSKAAEESKKAEEAAHQDTQFENSVNKFSEAVDKFREQNRTNEDKYKEAFNNRFSDDSDLAQQATDIKNKAGVNSDLSEILKDETMGKATDVAKDAILGEAESATAAQGAEIASEAMSNAATSSELLGAGMEGVAMMAETALPYLLAAVAALAILDKLFDQFAPAVEGAKKLFESMSKSANRYQESRKKNLELEKKRLEEDVKTMVETPFKILEEAAQSLYDAWDSSIRVINGTQGYTKDDLYNLLGDYAQRLRDENLTAVMSTSDITTNLTKVLQAGLSGEVAEEFAYLATKLNAAIPTQDFFDYAESYASIAANAMKEGKSQSEAISYANKQLEQFASDILYASRQLSGGFSTGLSNASNLFNESVKIAQAAKTNNSTQISGVLTSISAIVGAIAPDLSDSIVSAVVSAATGGNSSQIVALRSLAGVNASNTEFLKALANDPKAIFIELFSNLANLQNMSNDNYMEVAEGLADVFGISMEAFSRVDFNYLSDAISSMDTNNASLEDNMKLLASGQTTTNAEMLRMQQINQYMLDEGLSYVMDNEAARAIQQHMWDEQLAREMQEATYAVDLQGSALEFLEGIKQTIDNILNFLNPFGFLKKLVNLAITNEERKSQEADIKQLLELGKVGNGNARDLYNLTTRNQDLHLVSSLVDMMGGHSAYGALSSGLSAFNKLTNASGWMDGRSALKSAVSTSLQNALTASASNDRKSRYTWAVVGKSTASAFQNSAIGSELSEPMLRSQSASAANAIKTKASSNFQKYLDSMQDYIKTNQEKGNDYSYESWKATAAKYGIKDVDSALDQYGLSENDLKGQFETAETLRASEYEHERQQREDEFWEQGTSYFKNEQEPWTTWENLITSNQQIQINNQMTMIAQLTKANDYLNPMNSNIGKYLTEWTKYYIDHTAYSEATNDAYSQVKNDEKDKANDAILSLAKALTDNDNIKSLVDPTVQTNTLLAKILIVVEAIMQQNNQTGELSLPDALAALGLGAVNNSKKK